MGIKILAIGLDVDGEFKILYTTSQEAKKEFPKEKVNDELRYLCSCFQACHLCKKGEIHLKCHPCDFEIIESLIQEEIMKKVEKQKV